MTPPPPAYPSSSTDNLGSGEPSASTDYSYPPVSPLGSPPISSSVGGILDSTRPIRSSIDSTSSSIASSSTMPPIRQTVHSPPPAFGAPPTLTTASPHARSEVTRFLMTPRPIAQASGGAARSRLSFLPLAVTESLLGRGKSFAIQTADVTSPNGLPPVLIFHDTTPILGARSTSGTIELDHGVARALGVEPSWWIAVALAYVEFLDERDGYLAAADG